MMLLQIAGEELLKPETTAVTKEFVMKFGVRLLINFISVFILIRLIYFKINQHRELFFTYFIFNLVIFFMCFFLNKVNISMGAAFGLFAVFGMLRYRTEDLSIKDMTYLFLVIAIGLLTAVIKLDNIAYYYELSFIICINLFVIILTYFLESNVFMRKEVAKSVTYEKIELIKPDKRAELLEDLENRMGVKINRIAISKVDFSKNIASIKIYYFED